MPQTSKESGSGRFDWSDPFFLESQLSEEENLIRESARAFAQESLAPRGVGRLFERDDGQRHLQGIG